MLPSVIQEQQQREKGVDTEPDAEKLPRCSLFSEFAVCMFAQGLAFYMLAACLLAIV